MAHPAADRNLLFGILALQLNFITKDALLAALHAWAVEKHRPLAEILRQHGTLAADAQGLLDSLVARHLAQHGNDPARSLAALTSVDRSFRELAAVDDPDLRTFLSDASMFPDAASEATGNRTSSAAPGLRYRILRPHAEGGLGEVFIAEDTELRRHVALKEIKAQFADQPQSRGRFVLEAEITGQLEHPGIVPVYGLGTYPDGRPFYAMRFIQGDTLKAAIERFHGTAATVRRPGFASLEFRQLLRRFVDVCNAIAYAHSRGVLHRDLKPDNIMLGPYGETLVVDWGLAKLHRQEKGRQGDKETRRQGEPADAVGERSISASLFPPIPSSPSSPLPHFVSPSAVAPAPDSLTQQGAILGTPAFMSPEQAAGKTAELDPASDVYSLGAILYVMLTGRSAFVGSVMDVIDNVRDGRFPSPRTVQPHAPTALAAVCGKAMARQPGDRYASAKDLADDVEQWLGDEPVTAYQEPPLVRARRWGRKHPGPVAAGLAMLLTALIGLVVGLFFVEKERQQTDSARRDEATQRAEAQKRLKQVDKANIILMEIFRDLDPEEAAKDGVPLQAQLGQRLEQAAASLEEDATGDPQTVAHQQVWLGGALLNLGHAPRAVTLFTKALATFEAQLGPDHSQTLIAADYLAQAHEGAGQYDRALPLHERTWARRRERLGPEHLDTLTSMNNVALAYRNAGQYDRALPLLEQTLAQFTKQLGPNHAHTLACMNNLAGVCQSVDQHDRAVQLHQEALAKRRELLGSDHINTLDSMSNLGSALQAASRLDLALPLLEEVWAKRKAKLGADHPDTLNSLNNLGMALKESGDLDRAVLLLEQALAKRREKLGPDHPDTLTSMHNLAMAYRDDKQVDKALPLLEQSWAKRKEKLGPDHPDTLTVLNNLAMVCWQRKQLDRSVPLFEENLQRNRTRFGPDHMQTVYAQVNLGINYRDAGRVSESIIMLEDALARAKQRSGGLPADLSRLHDVLAEMYDRTEQFAKAEPHHRVTLEQVRQRFGSEDTRTAGVTAQLGWNLLRQRKYVEAETVLRECLALRLRKQPDAWATFYTQSALGGALLGQQNYVEAEPLLVQGYEGLKKRAAQIPAQHKGRLAEAATRLVQLYDAWNKPEAAAKWRQELKALQP